MSTEALEWVLSRARALAYRRRQGLDHGGFEFDVVTTHDTLFRWPLPYDRTKLYHPHQLAYIYYRVGRAI